MHSNRVMVIGSLLLCGMLSPQPAYAIQSEASSAVEVQLVTDQADAVLAILAKSQAGQTVTDADWQRLFASEGYRRLKKRQESFGRSFEEVDFREFALSEELTSRTEALRETLAEWTQADISAAAGLALAYLPPGGPIRAKVYPVIKPRGNSFVFETDTDPAIFLYLDPERTDAQFENTVAHELHHIGLGSRCGPEPEVADTSPEAQRARLARQWTSAFAEGVAMLAAAGGPDVHPHAASNAEERARWDKDVANFDADLKKVESFFQDILEGRLTQEDEIRKAAFSFFGIQGPWYTVGWKMAAMIENTYGRATLLNCLCDPAELLATYNKAAARHRSSTGEHLALWSSDLLSSLAKP